MTFNLFIPPFAQQQHQKPKGENEWIQVFASIACFPTQQKVIASLIG